MNTIDDVKTIDFCVHSNADGKLCSYQKTSGLPLGIKRVFVVKGSQTALRGQHAHREQSQVLVCLQGSITVTCTDGKNSKTTMLNDFSKALYLPYGIWSEQKYEEPSSTLMVLCDDEYDEAEYIRSYTDYLQYRDELLNSKVVE